jgi:NDP-sugar pyrophosphorylase family protein
MRCVVLVISKKTKFSELTHKIFEPMVNLIEKRILVHIINHSKKI